MCVCVFFIRILSHSCQGMEIENSMYTLYSEHSLWIALWCQVMLNQTSTDLCNNMLPHTFLLTYNRITRTSIYLRIVYTFSVICAINSQLISFIPLLFNSCACKRLVNLYSRNRHVDIIDEDILVRHHYTCKNQQFNFYANHHCVCNLLINVLFTVYIIIKFNPIQIIICYDPAKCLINLINQAFYNGDNDSDNDNDNDNSLFSKL